MLSRYVCRQRPLPAADGFAWLTGGAPRRELDSPLSVDWSNVILGSTLTNVSHSLEDLHVAESRVNLLAAQFDLQKKIVGLLQSRSDAGEISRSDLLTAQLALNQTQLDVG